MEESVAAIRWGLGGALAGTIVAVAGLYWLSSDGSTDWVGSSPIFVILAGAGALVGSVFGYENTRDYNQFLEAATRESHRIAAAFGIGEWQRIQNPFAEETFFDISGDGSFRAGHFARAGEEYFHSAQHNVRVGWWLNRDMLIVEATVEVANGNRHDIAELSYNRSQGKYQLRLKGAAAQSYMSRALYCLGFENPEIVSQLPELTRHEQLELRLSLPREFWPPKWT